MFTPIRSAGADQLARVAALVVFAAALAAPASAQEETHRTPSGPLSVVQTEDYEAEVHVGAEVFRFPEAMRASVMERVGDVFLIFLSTGGNACPGYFSWVDTTKGQLQATESFGTCSDLYEISFDAETISLKVKSMEPGEGDHLFTWDGVGAVTESVLGLEASDTPPGADPSGWLGRHPAELLDSSDWEALLLNVLSKDELADLRYAMKLSSGFEEQDGWIAAYGYQNISEDVAAIAIHPEGELLVAVGVVGQEGKLWGETERAYPEAIRTVLEGN